MKLDPAWNENETRAYKGDWKVWEEFAGEGNAMPADPAQLKAFVDEQIEEFDLGPLVERRMMVIGRIHELNGFPNPFNDTAESANPTEASIWKSLADGDEVEESAVKITRAPTPTELELVQKGTMFGALTSLEILGVEWPVHQTFYEWIVEATPPLRSLRIGDDYSDSYELGDPSPAIHAVSTTLRNLSLNGYFKLSEPLGLFELSDLALWGVVEFSPSWFEQSNIRAKDVSLWLEGVDANLFLPMLLNPQAVVVEIKMMENTDGLFLELVKRRETPFERYDFGDCDFVEDEGPVYDALIKNAAIWKQTELYIPDTLFDEEMLDSLVDQGFNIGWS